MSEIQETKPNHARRKGVLSSIRIKMLMLLALIGLSFGGFGYMMYGILKDVSHHMETLSKDKLPNLRVTRGISREAAFTKDVMIDLLVADNLEKLSAAQDKIASTSQALDEQINLLTGPQHSEFVAMSTSAKDALSSLAAARMREMQSNERIQERIADLQQVTLELKQILLELSQRATMQLNKGAAKTYMSINSSLSKLVKEDFGYLQLLLEARAELNLLAGTAVAFGGTKDKDTLAQLQGLADSSDLRLNQIADKLEADAPDLIDVVLLRSASHTLQSVIVQSLFPSESLRRSAMTTRANTDQALSAAVAVMSRKLVEATKAASSQNAAALSELLSNEVGALNMLLDINSWASSFQSAALKVTSATTVGQIAYGFIEMEEAALKLAEYKDSSDPRVAEVVARLNEMNNKQTGLAAQKTAAVLSQAKAARASKATTAAVLEIARGASALAGDSVAAIGVMAEGITADVAGAQWDLVANLMVAGGVFVVVMVMVQFMILSPLNRISDSTEKLAGGDREPITGFDRAGTEIHRIAMSLGVFRNGLVEKEEMERLAEQERTARMQAQTAAVTALAEGMRRLSQGDLTGRIETPLTEGYEQLRADFNRTLDTLNDTVIQVVDTAVSIHNGANEISQASDDLSHRTESQAATLEETAAALDEMTASVRSAAEGAMSVENTMIEARNEAENSGEVVRNAVAAMTEIEQSSSHIAQIISVIDDIAFQTNLLALNAGVEAARAGEAGRGFAVVASEVRALAQRSSDAASEIKTLIANSSKQVEQGVDLVGKAGEALQSISERVNHISTLISGISNGAQEQSTGLVEINAGMSQLDQVTQKNAAMVEEATAAGHLLNSDAKKLSGLVARFKTGTVARSGGGAGYVEESFGLAGQNAQLSGAA